MSENNAQIVALMLHPTGAGGATFRISPHDPNFGMADIIEQRGIQTIIPLLPGHVEEISMSPRELAKVTADQCLHFVMDEICKVLDSDAEKIYLMGFSLGAVLILTALCEISDEYPVKRLENVHILVVNTPIHIPRLSWRLARVLSKLGRRILALKVLENEPKPDDPEHIDKAILSRRVPLSFIIELYKLVWRLDEHLKKGTTPWDSFAQVSILQAVPDGLVDPRSAQYLKNYIGQKAQITWVENAAHRLFDPESWPSVTQWLEEAIA